MFRANPLSLLPTMNREEGKGVYSVCSSNEYVIRAAMRDAVEEGYVLIVESTANQVNQYGGYTGMTPEDFVLFTTKLAEEEGLDRDHLILGGDHLGPLTWTDCCESVAMKNSEELIASYVLAGYSKIHIDTSMKLADDPEGPLAVDVSASRGAQLALVVDKAFREYSKTHPEAPYPVLVVGSEVPIPGGSQDYEDKLCPTKREDFLSQVESFRKAFEEKGLDFSNVIGFVVQPGVEFGDSFVFQYDSKAASSLMTALKETYGLVFEGHSTDYQTQKSLSGMVKDGIAILKVGPEFTFRLREALLHLCSIGKEMGIIKGPDFRNVVLSAMDENPVYWKKYYKGTAEEIQYKKIYSYSDRIRYYLPSPKVNESIKEMMESIGVIPEGMLSQYFPLQYMRYMDGRISSEAESVVIDYIRFFCHKYSLATNITKRETQLSDD